MPSTVRQARSGLTNGGAASHLRTIPERDKSYGSTDKHRANVNSNKISAYYILAEIKA